jgi:hypothetical protein
MNRLKKGPELKRSELHVPDFVYDIYYDLKERHLLPLAAMLFVALIAVPIYVKTSAGSSEEPEIAVASIATGSAAGGAEALTVAKSQPGLRDPRKRLKHAGARDPFEVKGAPSTASESSSGEGTATEGSSAPAASVPTEATVIGGASTPPPSEPSALAETYVPPAVSSGTGSESSSGESASGRIRTRFASQAIDVRIVAAAPPSDGKTGKHAKPKPQVRRNLPELTMLPARGTPAVTFMGTTPDGKKALLVVSSDVVSIFGEGKCLVGSQSCQLLAVEPGLPETFVYGPQERTYRIQLLKIRRTLGAKPRRASLAAPKHSHRQSGSEGAGPAER